MSQDVLVGFVALAVIPWIGWTLGRGIREHRLPIGRSYVARDERPGAFGLLAGCYGVAVLLMSFISLDLLIGLGDRIR
jgi:hypothetical protein